MLDVNAPIIPYESMGGIKLYSTIKELKEVIEGRKVEIKVFHKQWIRYDIDDSIEFFFHLYNGKLFKICTLKNYKGKLFDEIYVGLDEEKLLEIDSTFTYDDMEEIYINPRGAFVEINSNNKVEWISIFIKEIYDEDFDEANW